MNVEKEVEEGRCLQRKMMWLKFSLCEVSEKSLCKVNFLLQFCFY